MADSFSLVDLGKLAEPINTLITKISNAAGILYEPTRIRKKAQAELSATHFCKLPIFRTDLKYTKSPCSCQSILHRGEII
jgi:hypothetical protein